MSNYILNPEINEELLDRIWSKVRDSPSLWGDLEGARKVSFIAEVVKAPVTILFEYGFAHFHIGSEPGLATVHMVFWSPSLYKNFDEMRSSINTVVEKYCLRGIEAFVPKGQRSLKKILDRLGFQQMGTIYGYYEVRGQLYDAERYLILKGEE